MSKSNNLQNLARHYSNRYNMENQRVLKVLERIIEVGAIQYKPIPHTPLDDACQVINTEDALSIFEHTDISRLLANVRTFDHLSNPFTPCYTKGELAHRILDMIRHLESNRESLIKYGLPERSFSRSRWLDAHLLKHCYTKMPVSTQNDQAPIEQCLSELYEQAPTDWHGNLIYDYGWAVREGAKQPKQGDFCKHLSCTAYLDGAFVVWPGVGWDGSKLVDSDGLPAEFCPYEKAHYIECFDAETVWRIETLRPLLLNVKVIILSLLYSALINEKPDHLIEMSHTAIRTELSDDDIKFLIDTEKSFFKWQQRVHVHRVPEILDAGFKKHVRKLSIDNAEDLSFAKHFHLWGGLWDIFYIIDHVLGELKKPNYSALADELQRIDLNFRTQPRSGYYKLF